MFEDINSGTEATLKDLARIWSDTEPSLSDNGTGLSISDDDTHLFANGEDHHPRLFSRLKKRERQKLFDDKR